MSRLIKISANISYTQNDIISLLEFIHFKYFDIKKINGLFAIFYKFPIVEEALKEIFYTFIYINKNDYENLLKLDVIKGGGKGYCFKQIVVQNLSPSYLNNNITIPFFNIHEREIIPRFLPEINMNNVPFIDELIKIEKNKTYLIEQDIFGRKDIDFIIIDSIGKEQYIYAFQASIFKK
jgi:hypothetical protein